MSDLKIFAGRSNEPLAKKIAQYLEQDKKIFLEQNTPVLGRLERRIFNDGEQYSRIDENVRGKDIFILQSTNQPDSHFKELLMLVHGAYQASAESVTAVIPYLGYSRQDWKDKSRAPVTVISDAKALKAQGIDRVLLIDVHSNVVTGVYMALDIHTDHLWARPVFARYLKERESDWRTDKPLVIVAPDSNAVKLARAYAKDLNAEGRIAMIDKFRPSPGEAVVMNVVGDVDGKDVLIVDDMIDSAKTTCNAAEAMKERGAGNICALNSHPVLSGDAVTRIEESPLKCVLVTDSINISSAILFKTAKIKVVSVAALLGEAIFRIHKNESVSSLF